MKNISKRNLKSILLSMFTIFIFVVSLICTEALAQNGEPFPVNNPITSVIIQNNSYFIIDVHCKSKNDDISFHTLDKGELFGWKFRVNILNSTLFFCEFYNGSTNLGVFEIYRATRDMLRCRICTWKAEEDGINGYSEPRDPEPETLFFKWLN